MVSIDEEIEAAPTENFFVTPLQGQVYNGYLKVLLVYVMYTCVTNQMHALLIFGNEKCVC